MGTSKVWKRVHMDLITTFLLLAEDKYRYVLTVHDLHSRHVQIIPLDDKQAETMSEALFFKVLLEHGVPEVEYSN